MKTKTIENIKKKIVPILRKNNVIRAGIFGSYARGENKKNSDIDILIKVKGKRFSLFDLVRLELELNKRLNKKTDLLTYQSISPYLKKSILSEEIRII